MYLCMTSGHVIFSVYLPNSAHNPKLLAQSARPGIEPGAKCMRNELLNRVAMFALSEHLKIKLAQQPRPLFSARASIK